MIYKTLTTKELYASIPRTETISQMMRDGIEQGSTQLAVSAMEELIRRGDTNLVSENLDIGLKNQQLKPGTSIYIMIANALMEDRSNQLLYELGKNLLRLSTETKSPVHSLADITCGAEKLKETKNAEENERVIYDNDIASFMSLIRGCDVESYRSN